MNFTNKFKNGTSLVIISVILLTVLTLNVSYSAFFQVKSLTTVKQINTGSLDVEVSLDTNNSIFNQNVEIFPTTFGDITNEQNGHYSVLTINNVSNLPVRYLVSIQYDYEGLRNYTKDGKKIFQSLTDSELRDSLVSFNYLRVAVVDNNEFINFTDDENNGTHPLISSFVPSTSDEYSFPIIDNVLLEDTSKNYKVYVWLDENTPIEEIGKYVFLKIAVESEILEEAN